jgi:carbonic anhydrase
MRSNMAAVVLTSIALAACQSMTAPSQAPGGETQAQHGDVHWAYVGEAGPENWGRLDEKFAMCSIGRNQSPIDLATSVRAELEPLRLDYVAGATDIQNNGHTIQVDYAPGSTLTIDGRSFVLAQFHFHTPSENTFNGKRFPLEGHLVHADKDGNLAVVALMFDDGPANPTLAGLWGAMPTKAGEKRSLPAGFNAAALLPADRGYYRFDGSLTTPPCSEGVRWLVLRNPVSISRAQVEQFAATLPSPNSRPVQPLNARLVVRQ